MAKKKAKKMKKTKKKTAKKTRKTKPRKAKKGKKGTKKAKKAKKMGKTPDAPRAKLVQLKKVYANNPVIIETLELYELFRDLDTLEKVRENEFRKGVNLKVSYRGNTLDINLDKLKEYSSLLERFISALK